MVKKDKAFMPTATIIAGQDTKEVNLDVESKMFNYIVKQLMEYTMSQNTDNLPGAIPLLLLLPKRMQNTIPKNFLNTKTKITYKFNDVWTYVWNTADYYLETGWYLDGKKVSKPPYY